MQDKITRRGLAGIVAAVAAGAQQSRPLPANADEELAAARAVAKANIAQIAKVKLPMSTEPAASFRA